MEPPSRAAAEETSTIEPPGPPCRVESRRTASRQQTIVPSTLTASTRSTRSTVSSSTRAFVADDAGVRDEGGERPHRLRRGEGSEHVGLDRDVGAHRACDATGRLDLAHDGRRCGGVVVVGQADGPSLRRGRPRHGSTDPATPTCDQRDPSIHRLTVSDGRIAQTAVALTAGGSSGCRNAASRVASSSDRVEIVASERNVQHVEAAVRDPPRSPQGAVDEHVTAPELAGRVEGGAGLGVEEARAVGVGEEDVVVLGQEPHRGGCLRVGQLAVRDIPERAPVPRSVHCLSCAPRRSRTAAIPVSRDHVAMSAAVAGPNARR